MVKIKVYCPPRLNLPGFWSVGRLFESGETEHEVPEDVVITMLAEIEAKVSILKVLVVDAAPAITEDDLSAEALPIEKSVQADETPAAETVAVEPAAEIDPVEVVAEDPKA
jgi:hypothetical protein